MVRISKSFVVILVALVVHRCGECDAARILGLFPLHGKSHYVMCETLLRGLAARGHRVDVVSHFPLKNPPPNYHDISIAGTIPSLTNNVTIDAAKGFTRGSFKNFFSNVGVQMCELLNLPQLQNIIKNPPNDPPYDLVINELFAADCYLAFARHLKVPMVVMMTSKLFDWMNHPLGNPQSQAFVPSLFSGYAQKMSFRERLINTLFNSFGRLQYWWYIAEQIPYVEKHFGIKVTSMTELYKDISVMLVNTHPSFDFVRPLTPGIIEVGGLHVTDGHTELTPEVKKWLDVSKAGCIYFSFGSMIKIESFPPETVKAFYTAFERIAPVRVLMKVAKRDELLPGLPKNVMTSSWLPQTRVLQHKNVKAFVSHGGLMSAQESVTYGVPMISIPVFGDQHLNARICELKNVAISLKYQEITPDSFTKSLKAILEDPLYRETSQRLSKLFRDRPMSQLDTAIYWVEYVLRNGNVLRSHAEDLYWWQVELLDVYGFIIAVVALSFYAVKRVIGLILCLIFSRSYKKQKSASITKKNK